MFCGGEFGCQTGVVIATQSGQCVFRDIDVSPFDGGGFRIVQQRYGSGIDKTWVNRQPVPFDDLGVSRDFDIRTDGGDPTRSDDQSSRVDLLAGSGNNLRVPDGESTNVKAGFFVRVCVKA
jgi:hypothetical protein